jgi:aspartate 1-decarboxylase
MMRTVLKSKIHRATVTAAELDYSGSLTLDPDLMAAADMLPFEKVLVVNFNNGARIETYLIVGKKGSGTVCLNGPAARLGMPGDIVTIMSFAVVDEAEVRQLQPKIVYVNERNRVKEVKVGSIHDESSSDAPNCRKRRISRRG